MINKILSILIAPFLIFMLFSASGCGKQEQEVKPEPVKVKSFKIEKKPDPPPVSGETEEIPDSQAKKDKVATSEVEKNQDEVVEVAAEDEKPVVEGVKGQGELKDQMKDADRPVDNATPANGAIPVLSFDVDEQNAVNLAYNPEGQVDPFQPLFQAKQEGIEAKTGKAKTIRESRRGKLSPLEKLDISQLKLTAIILGTHRSIAMVQEATGKGHVIKKGTYIGINSGRVVEITKNTVVIEEEVEDLLGKIIVRKRELKLQKPLGEM